MDLYKPFIYKGKAKKKYSVYVLKNGKKRLIHFGQLPYGQYKDKLGHYKNLDHNDKKRRDNYRKRMGKTNDKNTAKYYANKYLW
jgi:hypothetical protein